MMAFPTIICGAILTAVGAYSYLNGTPDEVTGKVSPTALIPAFFGGLLVVLGLIAFNPGARKHAMHLAAMVGLLGFLGGFMPLFRQLSKTGTIDVTKPAFLSGVVMIVVCAIFVGLCIKSFIAARKARQAG